MGAHAQSEDLVILVERQFCLGQVVAAVCVGQEGFGAIAGPLHRTIDLLGGPQCHHFFRIDENLRSETPTDVGRDDTQLVFRRNVVEGRQHQTGDMRILRCRVEREVLLGVIIVADRRARLHCVGHQAIVGKLQRDHICGLAEGFIGGVLVADFPIVDDVARRFGMQLRRTRRYRGTNVGGRREFFVIDDDRLGGVLRLILGLGGNHCDSLSDEAHRFRGHCRPCAHFHRCAVLGVDSPAADQVADLVVHDLLTRQHCDDARHFQGCG